MKEKFNTGFNSRDYVSPRAESLELFDDCKLLGASDDVNGSFDTESYETSDVSVTIGG